ncbi:hypothetical protein M3N64_13930 [Sporolactobacillus sp. CPB3-1]|uniref:Uncharacterized protein n=1 Tax=Sporolactobacillus mangiferae TaxID=2940498 RepID=A0ABT0MDR8_9BACL|nr:hypothetical protein [Sporolactobacillus mangiferae]MCL1633016.1 hypothetical protein [Sporolactobacillus mangiferae]
MTINDRYNPGIHVSQKVTDKLNTDFMDLLEIAFRNAPDTKTREEIVEIARSFKENLEKVRV